MVDKKRCFVIMPFSKTNENHTEKYWTKHFENRLKPLIESVTNVEAFRSQALRQDIVRQIINDLVFSHIVVADLTDHNSNVFWELGIRLSFAHRTITIAELGTKIPFDLKTKGVLFYDEKDFDENNNFTRLFKEAIIDCISNPIRPDSVVLETLTGRGSVYSVIHHQELIQKVDGLIFENDLNINMFLNRILSRVYENKSKKLKPLRVNYEITVACMGYSALELLLAEHYLEEDLEFYSFVHTLHIMLQAINNQLNNWVSSRSPEDWFLDNKSHIQNTFYLYQKRLAKIRDKLISSI